MTSLEPTRRSAAERDPGFRDHARLSRLTWLALIVLIPLGGLFLKTAELELGQFWRSSPSAPRAACAGVSFGLSLPPPRSMSSSASLVAWVLVRYEFPGRRMFDAIVDLPFALPTAVAGIALTTLYSRRTAGSAACSSRSASRSPTRRSASSSRWSSSACRSSCGPCSRCSRTSSRARGGRRDARRQPPADFPRVILPVIVSGAAHRLCARLRPRGRRIRLGHLHRRQHAECLRDRAAADRHPAGGVQLCRRHGDRHVMLLASFVLLLVINRLQRWSELRTGKAVTCP